MAFLKRDGYMGGEYAANQNELDLARVDKSKRYAYPGVPLVLLSIVSVAFAARTELRT